MTNSRSGSPQAHDLAEQVVAAMRQHYSPGLSARFRSLVRPSQRARCRRSAWRLQAAVDRRQQRRGRRRRHRYALREVRQHRPPVAPGGAHQPAGARRDREHDGAGRPGAHFQRAVSWPALRHVGRRSPLRPIGRSCANGSRRLCCRPARKSRGKTQLEGQLRESAHEIRNLREDAGIDARRGSDRPPHRPRNRRHFEEMLQKAIDQATLRREPSRWSWPISTSSSTSTTCTAI
jgi:diguanylate cyclase